MSAILVHQNFSTTSPHALAPPPTAPPAAAALAFLRREAAQFGPGLFGVRRDGSDAERLALARRFAVLGESTPVYVLSRTQWTDRSVRLLAIGTHPNGGPILTADHLTGLVRGFDAPVPILSNGSESPAGFGYITALESRDAALHGTITLSAEAEALLQKGSAATLSLSLAPDLSRLTEASLTFGLQEDEARLFPGGPSFRVALESIEPPALVEEVIPTPLEPSRAEAEEAAAVLLLPEEAAFYRRHSPVSALGEILSRRF
ncbi:hypothetical protein EON77_03420 [bacterium]|nr:MAG: hypothetical protein EON77_03420 [bacterium]